jgi:hypothetical protein
MPDFNFHVDSVAPEPFSAAPLLNFNLKIQQLDGNLHIDAIALRCQLRLEPTRRRYSDSEKDRLLELFGRPSQWSQTLRAMLWTHASTVIPSFTSTTIADLPVPCTYDFSLAMTKYFDALEEGHVPLSLLFSGTIFYRTTEGDLQTAPIPWDKDADYQLSVAVWREMMDRHYPNQAWMCLRKDAFDRLRQFKTHMGHASWEQTIDDLLNSVHQKVHE